MLKMILVSRTGWTTGREAYLGAGTTKRMLRGLSTSDAARRDGLLAGRGSPLGLPLLLPGEPGWEPGFGDCARGVSQLRKPVVSPATPSKNNQAIGLRCLQHPGTIDLEALPNYRKSPCQITRLCPGAC